jgi:putative phosphoesterase
MVKGNHDHYVAQSSIPPQVNSTAKIAIEYQITHTSLENRWELSNLPRKKGITRSQFGIDIFLVHGSPQYPLSKYIYPNSKDIQQLFDYLVNNGTNVLLLGHTHIPIIEKIETDENRVLILNPGSVGQPRDKNPKSSYAILDSNLEAEIVRVDYDIESVMNKISRSGLPISLAHRLRKGL